MHRYDRINSACCMSGDLFRGPFLLDRLHRQQLEQHWKLESGYGTDSNRHGDDSWFSGGSSVSADTGFCFSFASLSSAQF